MKGWKKLNKGTFLICCVNHRLSVYLLLYDLHLWKIRGGRIQDGAGLSQQAGRLQVHECSRSYSKWRNAAFLLSWQSLCIILRWAWVVTGCVNVHASTLLVVCRDVIWCRELSTSTKEAMQGRPLIHLFGKQISIKFAGNGENGPRKRWFHFGDGLWPLIFQPSQARGKCQWGWSSSQEGFVIIPWLRSTLFPYWCSSRKCRNLGRLFYFRSND